MLKSSIGSFIVNIYSCRHKDATNMINLKTEFDSQPDKDIIDIIHESLQTEGVFNFIDENENENGNENVDINREKPKSKISLLDMIDKNKVINNGISQYKYVFFTVEYGENGDRGVLEKPDGERVDITPEDYQSRRFHVFLAYPDDNDVDEGVLLLEYRGQYGVKIPIEKVLKKCVKFIGDSRYTLSMQLFAERDIVEGYIDAGKVTKLRLLNNVPKRERGAAIEYESREIIYQKPGGNRLKDILMSVFDNTLHVGTATNIREIDDMDPDTIKFEVETESGKRTYTSGRGHAGIIKEEMPEEVVRADGYTVSNRILAEMKRIFETQHLNND